MHKTLKLMSYLMYVCSLKRDFPLNMISAMDETPVWLDMKADTMLDFIGKKSFPLKTTGHEKSRMVVILATKVEGTKLPPFIVFNGKRKDLDKISGVMKIAG